MKVVQFDQYQRYQTAKIIVEEIKKNKKVERINILEIGANEHKNLEVFLPLDTIYYLDISLPEELLKDNQYILGDATNLINIKDEEYDLVIALDVYEHIPSLKREDFIREINRVSKCGVIMCAPFNHLHVVEAETRINEYHRSITTADFRWIKEHIDEKLPDLRTTQEMIVKLGLEHFRFEHGEINLWEKLLKTNLGIFNIESVKSLNKYYNDYIFCSDIGEKNYRTFFYMAQDLNCVEQVKENISSGWEEKNSNQLNKINEIADEITSILKMQDLYKNKFNATKPISSLYFKGENLEYDEMHVVKQAIETLHVRLKFAMPFDCLKDEVRFDPVESNCILTHPIAYSIKDGKRIELKIQGNNATITLGNLLFFTTDDPQFIIQTSGKIKDIYIEYELLCINEALIENITVNLMKYLTKENEIQVLQEENNKLEKYLLEHIQWNSALEKRINDQEHEKATLEHEKATIENENAIKIIQNETLKEELRIINEEITELTRCYQEIKGAFFWRITLPLRKILNLFSRR